MSLNRLNRQELTALVDRDQRQSPNPAHLRSALRTLASDDHEAAAGTLCSPGPDGCCVGCGVEMTLCNVCHGIGYHRTACPTMPESFDYARCEALRTALGRRGITGELFAACNSVLYGSDKERATARELLASNAARIAAIEGTP